MSRMRIEVERSEMWGVSEHNRFPRGSALDDYIYSYTYMYMYCVCIYIYIYIYTCVAAEVPGGSRSVLTCNDQSRSRT